MTIGLHEETDAAFAWMGNCTDANIVADVRAAVEYLKSQSFVDPGRIGVVGFCFWGTGRLSGCSQRAGHQGGSGILWRSYSPTPGW